MRLYHGSINSVRMPNVVRGRVNTVFGKGFYTTTSYEQAVRWSRIKRDRIGARRAVVSVYEFDERLLHSPLFKVLSFNGATKEWLDFEVQNRRTRIQHPYDIVIGPVADDNLYATILMYETHSLSPNAAIYQLRTCCPC